jgi:hypothetical protein
MGLLDDAIREHLELKRRHGADPSEVARQEHEALGPARRERESAPVAVEPEPESYVDEPELHVDEPEPFAVEPEPEPDSEPVAPEPRSLESRRLDPDIVDQPTMEHPAARPEPIDDEEEEEPFRLEEPAQKAEAEDDDVLEGTPEFLEETPEHDRLWFEQRPPRDFDFDD